MASDETMMTNQSSFQDEDYEDYDHTNYGFDHHNLYHNQHHHNLSRLSVCTNSTIGNDDIDNLASMCMSNLSIESFELDDGGAEADAEFSADGKDDPLFVKTDLLSSGSENESGSCYSLPATPQRQRNQNLVHLSPLSPVAAGVKDYASENEVRKERKSGNFGGKRRRRRSARSLFERGNSWENLWEEKKKMKEKENGVNSGESDGNGVIVITRPKGGNRSLCMDLEEVKACRDLGFELEHERISSVSFSNSTTLDNNTSSGGNSPIANWRISGPGDDPRDVKARLKVWAQAVAIASTTKYGS